MQIETVHRFGALGAQIAIDLEDLPGICVMRDAQFHHRQIAQRKAFHRKGENITCAFTGELLYHHTIDQHVERAAAIAPIIGPENVELRTIGKAIRT